MSLVAILDEIERAAKDEVASIKALAAHDADEILAEAVKKAERLRVSAHREALAPAEKERARLLHEAGVTRLRTRQTARERAFQALLDQVRARLEEAREGADYPRLLSKLLDEAVRAMRPTGNGESRFRIEIDPRDRKLIETTVESRSEEWTLVDGTETLGGIVLTTEDARVRIVNTLERRLENARAYLRTALEDRLSGEAEDR